MGSMSGLGSVRVRKSPETVAEGQNSSSRLASSGIQEVYMEQLSLFCGILEGPRRVPTLISLKGKERWFLIFGNYKQSTKQCYQQCYNKSLKIITPPFLTLLMGSLEYLRHNHYLSEASF